jgi:hypothetical protein
MLYILNLVIFGLVCVVSLGLVFFYANKKTTASTIMITYVGWLSGFLIIVLLPLDIYVVSVNTQVVIQLRQNCDRRRRGILISIVDGALLDGLSDVLDNLASDNMLPR